MTIRELALRHLRAHETPPTEATAILEAFAITSGKDIDWEGIAPHLPREIAARIDGAALGWMMGHRACDQPVEEKEPEREVRDGKMLAMPRGDE